MAKLASPKAKAKPAPKLAASKASAKPAKAGKALAKPKAEPKVKYKELETVVFNGYAKEAENPVFEKGDRITIISIKTDDDKNVILGAVKEEDYEDYAADNDSVVGDEVYASEVEKAPKLPDDPYAIALKEDESLSEFIKDEGDGDPLAAGLAATEAVAKSTFLLGGCLAQLYSGQKFREYDTETFADDIKDGKAVPNSGWDKFTQHNFDMNGRKAQSYIAIYRAFNRLGHKVDLAEISSNSKIGWVKLGAMANVVTEDNVEELIKQAETQNVEEFKSTVRTDYVGSAGETGGATQKVKRTTVKVVFYEETGAAVQQVVDYVGKLIGTEDLGTIYEYILLDWAHNSLEEAQVSKITKARTNKLKELKKAGVDISERQKHFDELTAQLEEEAGEGEETDADADEDGDGEE